MKIKSITAIIIALLIMSVESISFAASGTVEFKPSTTEVNKGETFTVTLSATSKDGINGIDTKYTYDSEKLELINEKVTDSSNWNNIGISPDITIICNSTQSIKNADIYILTFKVKENVSSGNTIKIETAKILLDTDAQINSEVDISSKKVEINVKEVSKDNPTQNNKPSNKLEDDEPKTTTETSPTKSGTTVAKGTLPKTGENYVILSIFIVITIVLSIIFYKKYLQHKDIK